MPSTLARRGGLSARHRTSPVHACGHGWPTRTRRIAWCQPYGGGRSFYTALGHRGAYWSEPLLLRHVLDGIEMAAGAAKFDCGSEDD